MGAFYAKSVRFEVPVHNLSTKRKHHRTRHTSIPYPRTDPRNISYQFQKAIEARRNAAAKAHHAKHNKPPKEELPNGPSLSNLRTVNSGASNVTSISSVLLQLEEEKEEFGYTPAEVQRILHTEQMIHRFNKQFDELDVHLAKYAEHDENSRNKLRHFVMSWRHGLAYPHSRIEKVCSDIPLAATSYLQQGISRCIRLHRFCRVNCFCPAKDAHHLLEDLLHRESLERFDLETEFAKITSSIVIKQNLKAARLYESVKHPDETGEEEEDYTISSIVHFPIPIHIEARPEAVWHLPKPEVLHKNYIIHENHPKQNLLETAKHEKHIHFGTHDLNLGTHDLNPEHLKEQLVHLEEELVEHMHLHAHHGSAHHQHEGEHHHAHNDNHQEHPHQDQKPWKDTTHQNQHEN